MWYTEEAASVKGESSYLQFVGTNDSRRFLEDITQQDLDSTESTKTDLTKTKTVLTKTKTVLTVPRQT